MEFLKDVIEQIKFKENLTTMETNIVIQQAVLNILEKKKSTLKEYVNLEYVNENDYSVNGTFKSIQDSLERVPYKLSELNFPKPTFNKVLSFWNASDLRNINRLLKIINIQIANGYKEGHWIWYIYPNVENISSSRINDISYENFIKLIKNPYYRYARFLLDPIIYSDMDKFLPKDGRDHGRVIDFNEKIIKPLFKLKESSNPNSGAAAAGIGATTITSGTGCNGRTDDYSFITDTGAIVNLNYLNQEGYEHKIYEQGTAGDCFYCCYAAAINERNRLIGNPQRTSMIELREIMSRHIESETNIDQLRMVYISETDDPDVRHMSISNLKKYLVEKTKSIDSPIRRQGTYYDSRVLSSIFKIGVIFISLLDGTIYCVNEDMTKQTHYTLILHDSTRRVENNLTSNETGKLEPLDYSRLDQRDLNHYRNIAIRRTGTGEPFKFVLRCDEVPRIIVRNVISKCGPSYVIGCP
jgi:hypothetical protein